ncbi:hypothetical protein MSPP1_003530 [Malassezia sp. CBS 17886]|nr:hypothetical protein MSPP1_003530 [Malassezia sp. CBS 17886]
MPTHRSDARAKRPSHASPADTVPSSDPATDEVDGVPESGGGSLRGAESLSGAPRASPGPHAVSPGPLSASPGPPPVLPGPLSELPASSPVSPGPRSASSAPPLPSPGGPSASERIRAAARARAGAARPPPPRALLDDDDDDESLLHNALTHAPSRRPPRAAARTTPYTIKLSLSRAHDDAHLRRTLGMPAPLTRAEDGRAAARTRSIAALLREKHRAARLGLDTASLRETDAAFWDAGAHDALAHELAAAQAGMDAGHTPDARVPPKGGPSPAGCRTLADASLPAGAPAPSALAAAAHALRADGALHGADASGERLLHVLAGDTPTATPPPDGADDHFFWRGGALPLPAPAHVPCAVRTWRDPHCVALLVQSGALHSAEHIPWLLTQTAAGGPTATAAALALQQMAAGGCVALGAHVPAFLLALGAQTAPLARALGTDEGGDAGDGARGAYAAGDGVITAQVRDDAVARLWGVLGAFSRDAVQRHVHLLPLLLLLASCTPRAVPPLERELVLSAWVDLHSAPLRAAAALASSMYGAPLLQQLSVARAVPSTSSGRRMRAAAALALLGADAEDTQRGASMQTPGPAHYAAWAARDGGLFPSASAALRALEYARGVAGRGGWEGQSAVGLLSVGTGDLAAMLGEEEPAERGTGDVGGAALRLSPSGAVPTASLEALASLIATLGEMNRRIREHRDTSVRQTALKDALQRLQLRMRYQVEGYLSANAIGRAAWRRILEGGG